MQGDLPNEIFSVYIIDNSEKKTFRIQDAHQKTVQDLFEATCQKLLLSSEYIHLFSLCLIEDEILEFGDKRERLFGYDNKVELWLSPETKLIETPLLQKKTPFKTNNQNNNQNNIQNKKSNHTSAIYFRMKYFLRYKIDLINCNVAKELIYKNLNRWVLDSKFTLREYEAANLASLSLQKQFGNYSEEKFKKGFLKKLLELGQLLPQQMETYTFEDSEHEDVSFSNDNQKSVLQKLGRRLSLFTNDNSSNSNNNHSSVQFKQSPLPIFGMKNTPESQSSTNKSALKRENFSISGDSWEKRIINIWNLKYSNEITKLMAQKEYIHRIMSCSSYGFFYIDDVYIHNAPHKTFLLGVSDDGIYLFQNHDNCILKEVYLFEGCETLKQFGISNFFKGTTIYQNILTDWNEGSRGLVLRNQFNKEIQIALGDQRKKQIYDLLNGYYTLHVQKLIHDNSNSNINLQYIPKRFQFLINNYSFNHYISSTLYSSSIVKFNKFNRFTRQLEYVRATYSQKCVQHGPVLLFNQAIDLCLDLDVDFEVLDLRDIYMSDIQFQNIVHTIIDSSIYCESNKLIKRDVQLKKLYIQANKLTRNSVPYLTDITDHANQLVEIYIYDFKNLGDNIARVAGSFSQLKSLELLKLDRCSIREDQEIILSQNLINVLLEIEN